MLIRQQHDSDRKNLQALADEIAPIRIAPLQGQQNAIHAVRPRKLDRVFNDPEAGGVV